MAYQAGFQMSNHDSENRASIRRIVNDSTLHTSERFLPQPTINTATSSAASSFSTVNLRYTRADSSSSSRQGSIMNEDPGGSTPTNVSTPVYDNYGFFGSRSASISTSPSYQDSAMRSDDYNSRVRMERRHSSVQESQSQQPRQQPQYMADGIARTQPSRRRMHALRQGLRRSENRAVLKISLAQGRIDSPHEPNSFLSSYNKQQSGRDVKETSVISMSTMTSAAKTRVFHERLDYVLERILEIQRCFGQLSRSIDPSFGPVLARIHDHVKMIIACARDRDSIRDRVGEVVESMQPVYDALVKDVQERTDNAGEVPFDAQTYFEHQSSLFQQMRTGRLDCSAC